MLSNSDKFYELKFPQWSCDAEFHSGCLLVRVGATAGAVPRPKRSCSLSAAVSSARLPRSLQSRWEGRPGPPAPRLGLGSRGRGGDLAELGPEGGGRGREGGLGRAGEALRGEVPGGLRGPGSGWRSPGAGVEGIERRGGERERRSAGTGRGADPESLARREESTLSYRIRRRRRRGHRAALVRVWVLLGSASRWTGPWSRGLYFWGVRLTNSAFFFSSKVRLPGSASFLGPWLTFAGCQ